MQQVPGYSALEPIGSGASATVYRAQQDRLGREVALKLLAAPHLDAKTEKRFGRESQALAALGWHPNIVLLLDAGTTPKGAPYIAMEYLSGGSLAERGPLPGHEVTAIGIKIAGALHAAHQTGVLHRDVKPGNILRDVFGEPKLADFGISGLVDATHTTGGGMTLAHVAPEVVDGRQATVASDVYSLASTLYELVVGAPPFSVERDEEMVALLLRIMDDPVPDCRAGGVPDQLAAALETGLAKDPAARPDAAGLGRSLVGVEQALGWPTTRLPIAEAAGQDGVGPMPADDGPGRVDESGDPQATIRFDTPPPG